MKAPKRSAALVRALASDPALPADFAARVSELAEARAQARHANWSVFAPLGAFVAMIGVCMVGWLKLGPQAPASMEWLKFVVRALSDQPWLLIGGVGLVLVQALTFRRRVLSKYQYRTGREPLQR